jgi:acyl-CoA thioester hydrolase
MVAERRASIEVERQIEWADTDAGGHHHFLTVLRWMEEVESLLHDRLGIGELSTTTPRVHIEVDFTGMLSFRDRVHFEVLVSAVGRSSITYRFRARKGSDEIASGTLITANCDANGRAVAVPDQVRRALLTSGPQRSD